jgi:hypothetical protein
VKACVNSKPSTLNAASALIIAFQRCIFIMDFYQQNACQRPAAEKSRLSDREAHDESVLRIKLDAGSLLSIHARGFFNIASLNLISLACSLLLLRFGQ